MDRRAIKFDWNRARAFLVTAEEGSLSAAARALDMTQHLKQNLEYYYLKELTQG